MSDMEKAYRLAAAGVRVRFAEQHPEYVGALARARKEDVAVFSGSYDQTEKALDVMGIPRTVDPDPKRLGDARLVMVNCSNSYDTALVERIAGYVDAGCTLVTSDWALDGVLEKAFPGTVRWNRKNTGDEVVSVEPDVNSLWSEIVIPGANPQWWLWGSHPVEVLDPERVRVEAASHDLLKRYEAPVVAARFDWGRGYVFHVISHFWAKRSGTPTPRHGGSAEDFLRAGMRLSEAGVAEAFRASGVSSGDVNFAQLQSAATATELIAQLCVQAVGVAPASPPGGEASAPSAPTRRSLLANPLAAVTALLSGQRA
jgi:hypothetical protein